MKVVLDTSVLVSGLRSPDGASSEILRQVSRGSLRIAASPAVFLEYEAVLERAEHKLPAHDVERFLVRLAELLEPVEIHFLWRPQLRDADDELILEAAINGHVDAIVTHNKRDFEGTAPRFGISVFTPAEFLSKLRATGAN